MFMARVVSRHTLLFFGSILACLISSVAQKQCKDNFWLYEKVDNIHYQPSTYECLECEHGKYGTSGICYDCPSFTRQRRWKDAETTLWCDNSCAEMFQNADALKNKHGYTITGGIESLADAHTSVLQYERPKLKALTTQRDESDYTEEELLQLTKPYAVCKACAGETFLVKHTADIVLKYFESDLKAMLFSSEEIESLKKEQDRFKRFAWTVCGSCPSGFVRGAWSVPQGTSIAEHTGTMIPCKACTLAEGVQIIADNKRVCKRCGAGQYQFAQETMVVPYTRMPGNAWDGTAKKVVVSFECKLCAAGFSALEQCRGSNDQCCSACPENTFKTADATECAPLGKNMVAISGNLFVESGGTAQRPCGVNEMLVVCYNGQCVQQLTNAWKTCVPCSIDQTTRSSDKSGCIPCSTEKKHLVDAKDPTKCTSCGSCQELKTVVNDEANLKTLPGFDAIKTSYTITQVQASCKPLERRQMIKVGQELQITGSDHWRDADESKGKPLPAWYFLDRQPDSICVKKHCKEVCLGRFEYSDGCGNSIESANTWVSHGVTTRKLASVTAQEVADVSQWTVLSQGKCTFCTPCLAGNYNGECNKKYEFGVPQGECKECRKECMPGYFMRHPDRDAGCHDPPTNQNSTSEPNRFHILHDYTCEKCPKWMLKGKNIYAVSACGKHSAGDTYTHFSSNVQSNDVEATQKLVVDEPNADALIAGVQRRNFRTFINNLKHYCPPAFFFKTTIPGCAFIINNAVEFQLHGNEKVQIGYEEYNARCCQPCTICDSATERKDMSSWRQCDGSSTEDLQSKCVEKCALGYWEEKNRKECHKCSTCFEGILSAS